MLDRELRTLLRDNEADENHIQQIRCRMGNHEFRQSDEPSKDCGCAMDPGIHGCHPMLCIHCGEDDSGWG